MSECSLIFEQFVLYRTFYVQLTKSDWDMRDSWKNTQTQYSTYELNMFSFALIRWSKYLDVIKHNLSFSVLGR